MLILDDGQVAFGDCASPQYAGSGGREPPLVANEAIPFLEAKVLPTLLGRDLQGFASESRALESLDFGGRSLSPWLAYGVSQAILDAIARTEGITMAEVICREYGLATPTERVPLYAQAEEKYSSVDRMILKQVDMLPHAIINNVERDLGRDGRVFLQYVTWVRDRVQRLGRKGYWPTLHFDLYGTLGLAFNDDLERMAQYIQDLERAARPFGLWIETPLDIGDKREQIRAMGGLRSLLREANSNVRLVVDEWCNSVKDVRDWIASGATDIVHLKTMVLGAVHNTVEASLDCKRNGVGVIISGGCNQTDFSARVEANLALATRMDAICGAPGMGVDEGLMIVYNEMQRVLALSRARSLTGSNL
jgi:methylaspartate ammonia-lyase